MLLIAILLHKDNWKAACTRYTEEELSGRFLAIGRPALTLRAASDGDWEG